MRAHAPVLNKANKKQDFHRRRRVSKAVSKLNTPKKGAILPTKVHRKKEDKSLVKDSELAHMAMEGAEGVKKAAKKAEESQMAVEGSLRAKKIEAPVGPVIEVRLSKVAPGSGVKVLARKRGFQGLAPAVEAQKQRTAEMFQPLAVTQPKPKAAAAEGGDIELN